jgi:hypothetical protein
MSTESNEGKAEKAFKIFGQRVDQFLKELDEAGHKITQEFDEKFAELKKSAEDFKKEAQNKERWKEVESRLKKASEEFEQALKAAFKKKND